MSCDEKSPKIAGHCGPCSPATRNRYFRGKLLTVSDYQAEQRYMIARRRLTNRAMLGWGVVSGFALTVDDKQRVLRIGAGVALDRRGREVVACEEVALAGEHDQLWLARGKCGLEAVAPPKEAGDEGSRQPGEGGEPPRCGYEAGDRTVYPQKRAYYLLAAHYAECPIDGVRVDDGCGAATCEANHVCETVVYSLTPVTDCPPGLPNCREPLFPWRECIGNDGRPVAEPLPTELPYGAPAHDRGTQDRLCAWSEDWLASSDPSRSFDPCKSHALCRVGDLHVDLDAGVPLACVTIGYRCGEAYIAAVVETYRSRRLARPNEALFDLIRGCDLVRIQDVGWSAWLKPPFSSSFGEFARMFERPPPRRGREPREPADTGFWVCFSGPVQVASLTPDVFTMTLIQRDTNEAVGNMVRVPIQALAIAPTSGGDPAGTTRSFRPLVNSRFWEGEINTDDDSGFDRMTPVEIEIRCDFIVDHLGQMVAGGGRFPPSRGTVPGGRFLSSFTVVPDKDRPATSQQSIESDAREA